MKNSISFVEAVKFFNEVGATAFPKNFPFLIEGFDPMDFIYEVRRKASKGYDVEIASFNDGNNVFEVTINLMDNTYVRTGFGAESITLLEAKAKGLVSDEEIIIASRVFTLNKECEALIMRVDSNK